MLNFFQTLFLLTCSNLVLGLPTKSSKEVCFKYCQVSNSACKDENALSVKVNTAHGCSEKCAEESECNWWTWYQKLTDISNTTSSCQLFKTCDVIRDDCNNCYTGVKSCTDFDKPFVTFILGGSTNQTDALLTSIEVYVEGKGPYTEVIQDLPSDFSSGWLFASMVGDNALICGTDKKFSPICYQMTLPFDINQEWKLRNCTIKSPRQHSSAVSAYGEFYVSGGYFIAVDGSLSIAVPFVEVFNPETDEWTEVTHRGNVEPRQRAGHCSIRNKDIIYFIGGELFDQFSLSMDSFNLTSREWDHLEFSEYGNVKNVACVMNGSDFVLISGGKIDENVTATVLAWNIVDNIVIRLPDLNIARHSHAMDFFDGHPVVIGGQDDQNNYLKSIEVFESRVWMVNPQNLTLQYPRSGLTKIHAPEEFVQLPPIN